MIKHIISLVTLFFFATSSLGMQKCSICEGMIQQQLITLVCNHTYHPSCIIWVCQGNQSKCPQAKCSYKIPAAQIANLQALENQSGHPAPHIHQERQQCFICVDKIPDFLNLPMVYLNCNHAYHAICILTWSDTSPICPRCKTYISDIQIEYFKYIVGDDKSSSIPGSNVSAQSHSFIKTYRTHIMVSCFAITAMLWYSYQDEIMAWLGNKKKDVLQEPIL